MGGLSIIYYIILCILLISGDNQFGFKKALAAVMQFTLLAKLSTTSYLGAVLLTVCAIDLSKAFHKVNHHALYIKLMKRYIPVKLLDLLENLISVCYFRVKWKNGWSEIFSIHFGVRQGSVLSPFLFAVYLDDLSRLCDLDTSSHIILYADDILLIAPSLSKLECVLHACERELTRLDMVINCKKSCCLRVGSRCDAVCGNIVSDSGQVIAWVTEMRYLGVYVTQSKTFKCSLKHAKRSFYRAANAVFAQVSRVASEEVTLRS